jgi:hypothetical protein
MLMKKKGHYNPLKKTLLDTRLAGWKSRVLRGDEGEVIRNFHQVPGESTMKKGKS